MPWQERVPVQLREQFITAALTQLYTMTELCARFAVSRKTGYKWLTRYQAFGRGGLADRSRAPQHCPHRVAGDVVALLLATRRTHPTWGPVKLLDYLRPRHPAHAWPAVSTVGDLLHREGLVRARRWRRPPVEHPGVSAAQATAPNALWTADFKGQFRTRDGRYCYPLTIVDRYSRLLLACQGLRSTQSTRARAVFARVFAEYGLPEAIRTDNGGPFATVGLRGLSTLNVWWLRLGIQHQRIQPAHPEQNGAHERLHKTLKAEAIRPPRATLASQQRAFNVFRREYNAERPHAALAGATPLSHYVASPRPYPRVLPPPEYPAHFLVKPVTSMGYFRFKTHLVFTARALQHQQLGLEETADGVWSLYLHTTLLGRLDERDYHVHA
jgi:transposase InsO family protein